jgi:hypothetical protein
MYLPMHPQRMARVGDHVMHVGNNQNQRGRLGKVTEVRGTKENGKVSIRWNDGLSGSEYSAEFCRNSIYISVDSYARNTTPSFNHKGYLKKYEAYAMDIQAVNVSYRQSGGVPNHASMKKMVDTLIAVAPKLQMPDPELPIADLQMAMMFPCYLRDASKGIQRFAHSQDDLAGLPPGSYEVFAQITTLTIEDIPQVVRVISVK